MNKPFCNLVRKISRSNGIRTTNEANLRIKSLKEQIFVTKMYVSRLVYFDYAQSTANGIRTRGLLNENQVS